MYLTMFCVNKKGQYSKHLDVCVADVPVFREILRLYAAKQFPH